MRAPCRTPLRLHTPQATPLTFTTLRRYASACVLQTDTGALSDDRITLCDPAPLRVYSRRIRATCRTTA
jgi:hypothetical protein